MLGNYSSSSCQLKSLHSCFRYIFIDIWNIFSPGSTNKLQQKLTEISPQKWFGCEWHTPYLLKMVTYTWRRLLSTYLLKRRSHGVNLHTMDFYKCIWDIARTMLCKTITDIISIVLECVRFESKLFPSHNTEQNSLTAVIICVWIIAIGITI